jgi:hypothetical protein
MRAPAPRVSGESGAAAAELGGDAREWRIGSSVQGFGASPDGLGRSASSARRVAHEGRRVLAGARNCRAGASRKAGNPSGPRVNSEPDRPRTQVLWQGGAPGRHETERASFHARSWHRCTGGVRRRVRPVRDDVRKRLQQGVSAPRVVPVSRHERRRPGLQGTERLLQEMPGRCRLLGSDALRERSSRWARWKLGNAWRVLAHMRDRRQPLSRVDELPSHHALPRRGRG